MLISCSTNRDISSRFNDGQFHQMIENAAQLLLPIMAVPPGPSLRSSSRQSTFLADHTATVGGSNAHPPIIHLGKRAHDDYLGNGDHQISKKLKINVTALSYPHVPSKAAAPNPPSSGEKSPGGVTLSTSSALCSVQPPTNSSITTNGLALTKEQLSVKSTVKHHRETNGKIVKVIDKRTLRSHDGGSRSKSELSLYFHNYDELISNESKNSGMFHQLQKPTTC